MCRRVDSTRLEYNYRYDSIKRGVQNVWTGITTHPSRDDNVLP